VTAATLTLADFIEARVAPVCGCGTTGKIVRGMCHQIPPIRCVDRCSDRVHTWDMNTTSAARLSSWKATR
jgi:hypothetical protein